MVVHWSRLDRVTFLGFEVPLDAMVVLRSRLDPVTFLGV